MRLNRVTLSSYADRRPFSLRSTTAWTGALSANGARIPVSGRNAQTPVIRRRRGEWVKGDTKSGMSVRPLGKIAVEIIGSQPKNDDFVFSYERGRPVSNLRPHFLKLEMPDDVSPHTLRHSFASLAADMGHSDNTIASLLGHSRGSITSRYMHLADRSLIAAADSVALETLRLMKA
jgi:integrase